jgi:hypothetical protein
MSGKLLLVMYLLKEIKTKNICGLSQKYITLQGEGADLPIVE